MSEEISGSLYYVIPAQIMHDITLSLSEKLIYALLSGLSDKYGHCFASNEYFEKVLQIETRQIQRYLESLEKLGYIYREFERSSDNPFKMKRKIFINHNFKKCLPDAENDGSGNAQSVRAGVPETSSILSKDKNLISKDTHSEASSSANASGVCKNFIESIKEINPKFKEPKTDKWEKEFDCMLKEDKRDLPDIYAMIKWVFTHPFWKTRCLTPSNLRKHFDTIYLQMISNKGDEEAEQNRHYCREIKKKFPDKTKDLIIRSDYAMNGKTGKDVSFNLPKETFRSAFLSMFGARYTPQGAKNEQNRERRENSELGYSD